MAATCCSLREHSFSDGSRTPPPPSVKLVKRSRAREKATAPLRPLQLCVTRDNTPTICTYTAKAKVRACQLAAYVCCYGVHTRTSRCRSPDSAIVQNAEHCLILITSLETTTLPPTTIELQPLNHATYMNFHYYFLATTCQLCYLFHQAQDYVYIALVLSGNSYFV